MTVCTVLAKEHSRQAYEHTYTASLTTQGTETITRVCTVLNSSKVNTRMSTHTCGIPGHTRHRKDYESVCSTEKQHSQQAYELQVHVAPLAIRGTLLQGITANTQMSTCAHSIPAHTRHREDNGRVCAVLRSSTADRPMSCIFLTLTLTAWRHRGRERGRASA